MVIQDENSYAIVEIGGTQVWLEEGQQFITDKVPLESMEVISLKRVLMVKQDNEVFLGYPYLTDAKVKGIVVEHISGPKLIVYKMKSKKKYRRKKGHRQQLTKILVSEVSI